MVRFGYKLMTEEHGPDALINAELPNVANFEAASHFVRMEDVRERVPCGPDVTRHVARIKKAVDADFDHIVLVAPGPEQRRFLRFWQDELQPELRKIHERSSLPVRP